MRLRSYVKVHRQGVEKTPQENNGPRISNTAITSILRLLEYQYAYFDLHYDFGTQCIPIKSYMSNSQKFKGQKLTS